ncbi:MAG TPA: GNAT family protein [Candidatus Thermoplasmatota archaeon]|nr:GNAT family protein [Candidatus Thermoplasmatota archaeon]
MLQQVTLHGRHVRLEPLAQEHADELWPAADEPGLWAHMMHDVHGREDLAAWVEARLRPVREARALAFVQRDARTGEAFGSTSLFDIDLQHRRMEVGHTWVGRTHRRTAANTEAKLLLLTHAFGRLDANRVQLKCDARNTRSAAAIARIGATFEGRLRMQAVLPDGHVRDALLFSIIRPEWPTVRARLEARLSGA